MCGIVGFVGPGDADDLRAMTAALVHRGPDAHGYHVDPTSAVYLGHRRLSILDIAGGVQPMHSADGRYCVIYNGEIYNFRELRAELETAGHVFATDHSDTEVLIHGYVAWGQSLPRRLNGMFAFAIYDRTAKTVFLARDRFGEKPLFWQQNGDLFAFASELTSLQKHPRTERTLSERGIHKYLAYGYVPGSACLYEKTHKLGAGCSLNFEIDTGKVSLRRYWEFCLAPDPDFGERNDEEVAEEFRSLMQASVTRRMISDVPLGLFLSGGIDSASILSLASKSETASSLKTFTIGFQESSFDESRHAQEIARHIGAQNALEVLDWSNAKSLLATVLERMDEPIADPSILPTYLLSRHTKSHVTVALSGDGGDELLAGYDPFRAVALAERYKRWVPKVLHRGMRRLVELMPMSGTNMGMDFKLKRAMRGLDHPAALWNPVWMGPLAPEDWADVLATPVEPSDVFSEALEVWERPGASRLSALERSMEFFTRFYLTDGILTKVDRASMAVSLEARAPFLDNDVVDFCTRLPTSFKYRNGTSKYLLKKAMHGMLPATVLSRPKKGFGIPLVPWMRQSPPDDFDLSVPGVRRDRSNALVARHLANEKDNRLYLWAVKALAAHLRGQPARREAPAGI